MDFLFHLASFSCDQVKMKLILIFALVEGILYFISFCVDGMRSVLNDTHFCAMVYNVIIFNCFDF